MANKGETKIYPFGALGVNWLELGEFSDVGADGKNSTPTYDGFGGRIGGGAGWVIPFGEDNSSKIEPRVSLSLFADRFTDDGGKDSVPGTQGLNQLGLDLRGEFAIFPAQRRFGVEGLMYARWSPFVESVDNNVRQNINLHGGVPAEQKPTEGDAPGINGAQVGKNKKILNDPTSGITTSRQPGAFKPQHTLALEAGVGGLLNFFPDYYFFHGLILDVTVGDQFVSIPVPNKKDNKYASAIESRVGLTYTFPFGENPPIVEDAPPPSPQLPEASLVLIQNRPFAPVPQQELDAWNKYLIENKSAIAAIGFPGDEIKAKWLKDVPVIDAAGVVKFQRQLVMTTVLPGGKEVILLTPPKGAGADRTNPSGYAYMDLEKMRALVDAEKKEPIKETVRIQDLSQQLEELSYATFRPGPSAYKKGSSKFYGENDQRAINSLAQENKLDDDARAALVREKLAGIVDPASIETLISVARTLNKEGYKNLKFNLVGHSSVDKYFDNQGLSERRTFAVRAALIAMGVNPKRIPETRGMGIKEPKYNTKQRSENRKNQRVELRPLSEDGLEVDRASWQVRSQQVSFKPHQDIKWSDEVSYFYRERSDDKASYNLFYEHFDGEDYKWGSEIQDKALNVPLPTITYFYKAQMLPAIVSLEKLVALMKASPTSYKEDDPTAKQRRLARCAVYLERLDLFEKKVEELEDENRHLVTDAARKTMFVRSLNEMKDKVQKIKSELEGL